jgi:hypothetical protein
MSVVFPKPDSPARKSVRMRLVKEGTTRLTNDHDGEVSASFGNDFVFLCEIVR